MDFYTKTEVNAIFGKSAESNSRYDLYTKAEIDTNFGTPETLVLPSDMLDFYTKTEIDSIQTYDETKVAVVELDSSGQPIEETVQYFDTVRNASSYISGQSSNFYIRVGTSCTDTSGFSTQRFSSAANLKIVEIYNHTTMIEDSCFENSGLEQIKLPDTITDIKSNAFRGCDLVELTIPGTAALGVRICGECDKLERVVILQGVTSIPQQAFQDCTSLTDVVIPDGVLTIGMLAFQSCGMSAIDIPSTVTSINSMTFTGCTKLTQIVIHQPSGSISGAPWGATNATVTWTG